MSRWASAEIREFTSIDLAREHGFFEMAVNRAVFEAANLRNFGNGLALPEKMQRLAHGVRQPRAGILPARTGWKPVPLRERIIRKNLARVRLQMRRDLAQEHFAEFAQFPLAHAADAR